MFRRYQSFSVAVATCRLNDLSVTVMFTSYVDEMHPAKAALYLQERQLFPRPLLFRTQFLSDIVSVGCFVTKPIRTHENTVKIL